MAVARIPQLQQDALPLITLDPTINGGTVVILGGKLVRQFSAADLGINNVPIGGDPDGGVGGVAIGSFVDLTGCNNFGLVLIRTADTLAHDNAQGPFGITVYFQMRSQGGVTGRTDGMIVATSSSLGNVTTASGGTLGVAPGYPFSAAYTRFGYSNEANRGSDQVAGSPMGNAVRFILSASGGSAAGITFSLELFAQG